MTQNAKPTLVDLELVDVQEDSGDQMAPILYFNKAMRWVLPSGPCKAASTRTSLFLLSRFVSKREETYGAIFRA